MKKHLWLFVFSAFIFSSCQQADNKNAEEKIIEKPVLNLTSDRMTPEVLWAFGRVSDPQVSPDGQTILYGITYYSIEENKGNRELYTIGTDGSNARRITTSAKSEFNAVWRPDGEKIGFLSSESGSVQLWEMNPDGSGKKQISDVPDGITGFKYAPDQSKILYAKELPIKNKFEKLYEGLPQATGRLNDDLMYRHWDTWVESISHIFVADYDGTKIFNDKDILEGEPYDSPTKPFGGMEEVAWSPDSKTIAYTCKKLTGKAYSLSTNTDIYLYNYGDGKTINLTEEMKGYDLAPQFSPDGKYVAWQSMERDGYESDQSRLYMMNMETGEKTYATRTLDLDVRDFEWAADNSSVYFICDFQGTMQIYNYALADGVINKITDGLHDIKSVTLAGDMLIGEKQTMALPTELFAFDPKTGEERQITFTNSDLLEKITMGKTEGRRMTTADGQQMLTWIIYPPHFDSTKQYPALLYCKGGPQGPLSQDFHYRWNYQIMVANDYIIVAPNRRGVSGFGQAWQEQISGDYHGKSMQDYLTAIDEMAKEPFVDKNRLGAVGASAGGHAVYYLAGNHQGRFKAFIAHDGIFNEEAQYLETEEMWFANWDMGGPFWDKENEVAQETFEHSPHRFVQNWDTPILIIHGERDYRVVYTQGMTAFNAAVLKGVPAEFLFYPDETHFVLKPQNAILWQRTFFDWLDKWLK
ncbi:MAG: S9 family peptidase [Sphingobacteriia bacterium]|nr:S9 family peptidase [Sphingobacteriia bacterium]